jgi:hypothetical protein
VAWVINQLLKGARLRQARLESKLLLFYLHLRAPST